jgi:hypothetical protein
MGTPELQSPYGGITLEPVIGFSILDRSYDWKWPGIAKADFTLTAVNQSSKARQFGKFRAVHQGPVMAAKSRRHPHCIAVIRHQAKSNDHSL